MNVGGNPRLTSPYTPPGKSEEPNSLGVRGATVENTQTQSTATLFAQQLKLYPTYNESFNAINDLAKSALDLINSGEDHSEILMKLKEKPGFSAGVFCHLETISGNSKDEQLSTFNKLLPYLNLQDSSPEDVTPSKNAIKNLIMWNSPQAVVDSFTEAIKEDTTFKGYYENFSPDEKLKLKIHMNMKTTTNGMNFTELKNVLGIES